MDCNKEEALRCTHIAKDAIAAGDKQKALKFLGMARRLNKYLPVDNLFAACENLDSSSSGHRTNDAKNATKVKADKASVNGDSFSNGEQSCTKDPARLVKEINSKKDYYAILGVERNCSVEDIENAYRKLSLKVCPDKNKVPGAEEAFKKVSIAFSCLIDDESRKQYDRTGLDNEFEQHNQQNPFEHDQQDPFRRFFGVSDKFQKAPRRNYARPPPPSEGLFRQFFGDRDKFQKAPAPPPSEGLYRQWFGDRDKFPKAAGRNYPPASPPPSEELFRQVFGDGDKFQKVPGRNYPPASPPPSEEFFRQFFGDGDKFQEAPGRNYASAPPPSEEIFRLFFGDGDKFQKAPGRKYAPGSSSLSEERFA